LTSRPPFISIDEDCNSSSLTESERHVLALLFRRGPQTQSYLADGTGLTQQSMSRLFSKLESWGMLVVGDKLAPGKRGYPSNAAALNPRFARSAGVAIMADSVALAVCDFAGALVWEESDRLPAMTVDNVLEWTGHKLASIVGDGGPPLSGIGIGIAGSFIGERTGFNTPFYLNDWAERDVEAIFRKQFGLPACADNDGNVAALGEAMLGVGHWAENFAYLYISAGVGGGVVLDGEVWRGRYGNAGEFAGGLASNIHPFPNLELLRQLTARHGPTYETVSELVANYDPAWPSIDIWISRVRDSLSIIASNASAILDVDAIVLGGLIPRNLAERVIPAIEFFDQRRRMTPRPIAKIVPAEAPGNATAIGAAMLPLKRAYLSKAKRSF
jgi:predicted NBD/HSP70 family sugar kinase